LHACSDLLREIEVNEDLCRSFLEFGDRPEHLLDVIVMDVFLTTDLPQLLLVLLQDFYFFGQTT
jgi:hypothetical protein